MKSIEPLANLMCKSQLLLKESIYLLDNKINLLDKRYVYWIKTNTNMIISFNCWILQIQELHKYYSFWGRLQPVFYQLCYLYLVKTIFNLFFQITQQLMLLPSKYNQLLRLLPYIDKFYKTTQSHAVKGGIFGSQHLSAKIASPKGLEKIL